MKRIAIFASGGGSNAVKIKNYFDNISDIHVAALVCNNPKAGILNKVQDWNIEVIQINRDNFYQSNVVVDQLKELNIDYIALAGFLWLIPQNLLAGFPNRIINIHPALLPKYGGKGMYGMNVHKAVLAAKEQESGITIHTIDEEYDRGEFLYQEKVNITDCSTAEEIAAAVLKVEHANFPRVIHEYIIKNA